MMASDTYSNAHGMLHDVSLYVLEKTEKFWSIEMSGQAITGNSNILVKTARESTGLIEKEGQAPFET